MRKGFLVLMVLTMIMMLLATAVAFAATVAAVEAQGPTPLGQAIGDAFNNTILPLIASALSGLFALVLLKLRQKFNVQLSAETEKWLQDQAEKAVQMVTEKAAAKLKFDDIRLTKNDKLDMAIAALIAKAPHLTKEQADAYVHAALARISGVGATQGAIR